MKLYPLVFAVILLAFFSCKKTGNSDAIQSAQPVTGNLVTTTVLTDTIPPTTAVSVKKYGVVGDGVHDDTNALQSALNSETILFLPAGTYIINSTLNMLPGVKLYGTSGAIIKAGTSMHGTLLTYGRFIYVNTVDNCLITNIRFQQSTQTFNLSNYANACIYVINSKNTNIAYNFFDFNLPYRTSGLEGVWITGLSSANNIIKGNKLISAGIEYAENGAGTTTVDGNYVSLAPADGISAHGNSSVQACLNNIVKNNTIINSGFMGIEDWGNMDGTIISNNTITGTGKDPSQLDGGMGISAVGANAKISSNLITDAVLYYIESGGSNVISNNVLNDSQGLATGIIINFTGVQSANSKLVSNVSGNTINKCYVGILVFGNYTPITTIDSNTLNNPVSIGISFDSSSASYNVSIANNTVKFNIPNTSLRTAYGTYTTLSQRTTTQNITLNSNTANYALTAAGGPGLEKGFVIATDNTVINGNKVYGNNIKAGNSFIYAITGNTNPAKAIILTNNMVYDALVNLQDFTITTKSGNNFN